MNHVIKRLRYVCSVLFVTCKCPFVIEWNVIMIIVNNNDEKDYFKKFAESECNIGILRE